MTLEGILKKVVLYGAVGAAVGATIGGIYYFFNQANIYGIAYNCASWGLLGVLIGTATPVFDILRDNFKKIKYE